MISEPIKIFLQEIGSAAFSLGHEVCIVGGYPRNKLYEEIYSKNKLFCTDIDLVINTDAIEFTHKLQKYLEDNDKEHLTFDIVAEYVPFGTIKINHPRYPEYQIELASTRIEHYSEPAAFPQITIIDDIREDLPRRDFTINALLFSLMPEKFSKHHFGEVVDYVSALDDLRQGLIRVFHNHSFIDDPTRIYRAVRFMFEYNFTIEKHTHVLVLEAVKHPDYTHWLKKRESRFTIELEKIKKLPEATQALKYLATLESQASGSST